MGKDLIWTKPLRASPTKGIWGPKGLMTCMAAVLELHLEGSLEHISPSTYLVNFVTAFFFLWTANFQGCEQTKNWLSTQWLSHTYLYMKGFLEVSLYQIHSQSFSQSRATLKSHLPKVLCDRSEPQTPWLKSKLLRFTAIPTLIYNLKKKKKDKSLIHCQTLDFLYNAINVWDCMDQPLLNEIHDTTTKVIAILFHINFERNGKLSDVKRKTLIPLSIIHFCNDSVSLQSYYTRILEWIRGQEKFQHDAESQQKARHSVS